MLSTSSTVDDDDEFCWQSDRFAAAKFSKSAVWDKLPDVSTVIFGDTEISLQRSVRQVEGSLLAKISSIRPVVSIQRRLVTDGPTERRTDRRTHDDSNYRAGIASRGKIASCGESGNAFPRELWNCRTGQWRTNVWATVLLLWTRVQCAVATSPWWCAYSCRRRHLDRDYGDCRELWKSDAS